MSPSGPTAALVVHYHGGDATLRCLRSLLAGVRRPERIVVLDNGSDPDWRARLAREHAEVELRPQGGNLGFAGALTAALADLARGSGGEDGALLVLNQDCELDAACLDRMERTLREAGAAAVCPTVLDGAGRIWSQGGEVTRLAFRSRNRRMGEAPGGAPEAPFPVDYAPGCALLVTARAWREAGGMHAPYFMYAEDADLGLRLRRLGYSVVCEPRATCRHEGSAAAGSQHGPFQSYFRYRNRLMLMQRNASWVRVAFFLLSILPLIAVRDSIRYALRGQGCAFFEALRGLAHLGRPARPPLPGGDASGGAD